ncbi:phosphatidylglycerophosphatase [Methanobrevibacter sp.]|uniref:phosphatidylglycerophosphatase n=1 Tax=Methanobrevibacter sp. TaxID=66852 RepID=UPI00388DAD7B
MKRVNIIEKDYGVFINNPKKFMAMSDFTVSHGIDIVDNVNIIIAKDDFENLAKESNNQEERLYIAHEVDSINFFKDSFGDVTLYTFVTNDVDVEEFTDKLQVANSPKGFGEAKIDISHVIYIDKVLTKKDLLKLFKKVSKAKAKYLASLNLPIHISNILNTNDFLAVLCNVPDEKDPKFDKINIFELGIGDAIETSIDESFKKIGLTFGVLDYLVSEGILIGDLIDAGFELLDGEATDELSQKMEDQLLKSLADINVITLLMAAIRTEQDFNENRIREIDINDDSLNLYSDEMLGLAVSNQIAGTNAAFNFKRYYAAKPGVLAYLPPVLDSIFAGLIAGCMSKILEE